MCVKSGRDNHQIGGEFRCDLFDGGLEGATLLGRWSHGSQRHVQSVTPTSSLTGFGSRSCARVPGVLMHRKVKNRSVVIEYSLSPITVVHVPVENRNSLDFFV